MLPIRTISNIEKALSVWARSVSATEKCNYLFESLSKAKIVLGEKFDFRMNLDFLRVAVRLFERLQGCPNPPITGIRIALQLNQLAHREKVRN